MRPKRRGPDARPDKNDKEKNVARTQAEAGAVRAGGEAAAAELGRARTVALFGLLTALALVLSYAESLLPLSFAVPGIKMGLPNIAVLFTLYRLGFRQAATVSGLRVLLVSVLFGNVFSLAYSAAGALLSLLVMQALRHSGRFGVTAVSVAGGVAHNAGQIGVAMLVLQNAALAAYFPVLCVSGVAAGLLVGLAAAALLLRLGKR